MSEEADPWKEVERLKAIIEHQQQEIERLNEIEDRLGLAAIQQQQEIERLREQVAMLAQTIEEERLR